jgi:hypothetical protein
MEFDALLVADGAPKDGDFWAVVMLQGAFRHLKAIGAWGDGVEVLAAAGIESDAPGVLTGQKADVTLAAGLVGAVGLHPADRGVGDPARGLKRPASGGPRPLSRAAGPVGQRRRIARHTASGVRGMSMWSTARASQAALTTAGGTPMQPASPAPFAPNGWFGLGVTVSASTTDGMSAAVGSG